MVSRKQWPGVIIRCRLLTLWVMVLPLGCQDESSLPPTPTECSTTHACYQLAVAHCACCPYPALCEQDLAQLCARDALLVESESACAAQLPFDVTQCDSLDNSSPTLNLICFGGAESSADIAGDMGFVGDGGLVP